MDWAATKVLASRLSTTMEAGFCVEDLGDAMARYDELEIFNTDQGSPFTGFDWTNTLTKAGVKISMDGRCRWIDNRFIERHWRSPKYECLNFHAFEVGSKARNGIRRWIKY